MQIMGHRLIPFEWCIHEITHMLRTWQSAVAHILKNERFP